MKKIQRISLLLAALLVLNGCAGQPAESGSNPPASDPAVSGDVITTDGGTGVPEGIVIPSNVPDYFELLCENTTATFYMGSGGMRFLEFWLISTADLEGEVMTVRTDTGREFENTIHQATTEEPFTFPFYVFAAYQGIPWDAYAQNEADFAEELETYYEAYMILKDSLPVMYTYRTVIAFESLGIDEDSVTEPVQLHSLTVTIGSQTKEYSLGSVNILPDRCTTEPTGGLSQRNGHGGLHVEPSSNGYVEVPAVRFRANNDLVLEGISFAGNGQIEILDCTVSIGSFTFKWDCSSPLEVDAGSEVSIEVTLGIGSLANALIGSSVDYMIVHYSEDGTSCASAGALSFLLFSAAHDVYAWKVDNVDMLPYYLDYRSVVPGGL